MPTALECTEYERFSMDEASNSGMTLDEAVGKAREMRAGDSGNFYRVEAIDQNANSFRIDKVPAAVVYADIVSRMVKRMFRYSRPHR